MGIVEGSITVSINSAGNYSVQLPKVGLDIIGFSVLGLNSSGPAFNGPPVVGVYLDASNIAYFPIIGNFFTMRKYTPVHIKLKGSVLNLNIPFASGNYSLGGLTIFYGKPSGDEIEIEIEWVQVKNECHTEYGNTFATLKWDVWDSVRVTNLQTGDVWDCSSKPEKEWEIATSEALLNGVIGLE